MFAIDQRRTREREVSPGSGPDVGSRHLDVDPDPAGVPYAHASVGFGGPCCAPRSPASWRPDDERVPQPVGHRAGQRGIANPNQATGFKDPHQPDGRRKAPCRRRDTRQRGVVWHFPVISRYARWCPRVVRHLRRRRGGRGSLNKRHLLNRRPADCPHRSREPDYRHPGSITQRQRNSNPSHSPAGRRQASGDSARHGRPGGTNNPHRLPGQLSSRVPGAAGRPKRPPHGNGQAGRFSVWSLATDGNGAGKTGQPKSQPGSYSNTYPLPDTNQRDSYPDSVTQHQHPGRH